MIGLDEVQRYNVKRAGKQGILFRHLPLIVSETQMKQIVCKYGYLGPTSETGCTVPGP